jgi:hypothetical protein
MSKNISRSIIRAAMLGLAVASSSAVALAQRPAKPDLPFARGEELVYQAEFNRSLLRGVNVGELRFSAKLEPETGLSGTSSLQLAGNAQAKGFLLKLFGSQFRLQVDSVLDADSFAVLRTKKIEEDRRRTRVSEAVFDHALRKVTWTERDQNQMQPPNITTVEFAEPIQDVLTVIYFLRTRRLQPGQTFDVPLSDNGRVYRCAVAVVERKKIKSILGKVDAVRVEPAIFGDNRVVRSRGTLSIWITDDDRRIPIKAQLKVPMGTFDIKLKRVTYRQPDVAR